MKVPPIQVGIYEHRQNGVSSLHRMVNEIVPKDACYNTKKGQTYEKIKLECEEVETG
jgi:hypothetical protein